SIELAKARGRATGGGWLQAGTGSFSAELHGTGFNIADFKFLQGQPHRDSGLISTERLNGELKFDASDHGTLADPQVHSAVDVSGIAVGEVPAGDLHAQVDWHGHTIDLHGDSEGRQPAPSTDSAPQQGPETLHFDCTGQSQGNWPITAHVQYTNYRLDP